MKKVLFFIRSLNIGGAERQCVMTAKGLAERGYEVTVLTFYSSGFYAGELRNTSVQLLNLNKKGRWDVFGFLWRFRNILRQQAPDVIYSFSGTANIFTVLIRSFIYKAILVWGVRASNMDLDKYDWLSRWSYHIECHLSKFTDLIIANSNAGKDHAVAHGFPKDKIRTIHNGIDTEHFYPDKTKGVRLREQWGLNEAHTVIGVVGRIDPIKGIPIFLEAVAIIKQNFPALRFVWVGTGDTNYEKAMHQQATALGLDEVLIWAGRHTNMLAVYNAIDIASSSSYSEGFPNVLGEAMACGIPCIATDVGDSAIMLGDIGEIIPAKNINVLVATWNKVLSLDDDELRQLSGAIRKRVTDEFSVHKLLNETESLLNELL